LDDGDDAEGESRGLNQSMRWGNPQITQIPPQR